jgi:hypothetical protein
MTRKKFFLILLLTLFFYNFGYSDFGYRASKISIVLSESDLIFIGKVNNVDTTNSKYISYIEVVEILKGSAGDKNIVLNSKRINGYPSEDEAYPKEGNMYVFFCRKDGEGFVFTTTPLGILSVIPYVEDSFNSKDDIKLLLSAINTNKELFSKAGKQDLFNLYPQLKIEYIKSRFLDDLEDLVDENDIEFFATGLESDDVRYNLFSITKAGYFRIEQCKETIANLLITTPDIPINANKIFHLLYALGFYGDIKYKDIFFEYLNNVQEGFRSLAVTAIARIHDLETLLALVPYYEQIQDKHYLLNILEGIEDNDILIPVLLEFRQIETGIDIIERIDRIIAKRTIIINEPEEIPNTYSLSQNYPNPFNPTTTIQYNIPKDEFVKLIVYDVTGKIVKELVSGYKSAGKYSVEFNAINYASGTYYYKIEAGEYKNIQKMMLVK